MADSPMSDGTEYQATKHRLGQDVDAMKDDVGNFAHHAMDAARTGSTQAMEAAKDKLDAAKKAASDATDSLKDVITRNPLASIGIAAGLGMLIGLVVFRPRS